MNASAPATKSFTPRSIPTRLARKSTPLSRLAIGAVSPTIPAARTNLNVFATPDRNPATRFPMSNTEAHCAPIEET